MNGAIKADGVLSNIRSGTGGGNHFMDTSGIIAIPTSTHTNTKISKFLNMIPQQESNFEQNMNNLNIQEGFDTTQDDLKTLKNTENTIISPAMLQ